MSKYVSFVADSVKLYNDIAVYQVQKAFEESFDQTAEILLESYLSSLSDIFNDPSETGNTQQIDTETEKDMREMEKAIDIAERNKNVFRSEIHQIITSWRQRGKSFNYTSEPRLKAAIEARLLPSRRKVERGLTEPRFAKQKINWARKRKSILERLVNSYGYCNHCSEDLINYVNHVLKNRPVLKTPRGESVEWLWDFNPN
jgi:serine protein kinase